MATRRYLDETVETTDLPFDKACHAGKLYDEMLAKGWKPWPAPSADFFGITTSADAPRAIVHLYDAASQADKDEVAATVNAHEAR